MCIRDRYKDLSKFKLSVFVVSTAAAGAVLGTTQQPVTTGTTCLLYTSDAADDLTRVDLGGRRIIKKKNDDDEYPMMMHEHKLFSLSWVSVFLSCDEKFCLFFDFLCVVF